MQGTAKRPTTKRERIVRKAALRLGITLATVAEEMGFTPTGLQSAFEHRRPRAPTLDRFRRWLDRREIRKGNGRPYSNEDLLE